MRFRSSDTFRLIPVFLPLLLLATLPARGDATLRICNQGTTDMASVVAISEPYAYHVIGWSTIAPRACKEIYNTPGGDAALVGFAYHDAHGVIGPLTGLAFTPIAGDDAAELISIPAVTVCVRYDTFEYRRPSRAGLGNCDAGYFKMPFELSYKPAAAGTSTVNLHPDRDDPATPMDGTMGWYRSFFSKSYPVMLNAGASGFAALRTGAPTGADGARIWKLKMDRDDVGDCQVLEGPRNSILCKLFKSRSREGAVKNYIEAQNSIPLHSNSDFESSGDAIITETRHSPEGFDLRLAVTQTSDGVDLSFQLIAPASASRPSASPPSGAQAELQAAFDTGVADIKVKKYQEAIPLLFRASQIDPKQDLTWANLATAYLGLADQKSGSSSEVSELLIRGLDAYRHALALRPDNPAYLNNYALAAGRGNEWQEARASLEKAASLDPANAGRYYFNLGALLANGRQYAAAREAFGKVTANGEYYAAAQQQLEILKRLPK